MEVLTPKQKKVHYYIVEYIFSSNNSPLHPQHFPSNIFVIVETSDGIRHSANILPNFDQSSLIPTCESNGITFLSNFISSISIIQIYCQRYESEFNIASDITQLST